MGLVIRSAILAGISLIAMSAPAVAQDVAGSRDGQILVLAIEIEDQSKPWFAMIHSKDSSDSHVLVKGK